MSQAVTVKAKGPAQGAKPAQQQAGSEFEEPHTKPLDSVILRRIWQRMQPYKRQVYFNLALTLGLVFLELVPPRITKTIIDANIPQRDRLGLLISVGILASTIIGIIVLSRLQIWRVVAVGNRIVFDLREEIFRHLQRLSMSYYDRMKAGRIIARGTSDVGAMRNTIVWALPRLVGVVFVLLGAIVMMALLNLRLFAACFFTIPLLWLANHYFRVKVSQAWRRVREAHARVTANIAENIAGMRVIQAYTRESRNLEIFNELQDEAYESNLLAAKIFGTYMPTLDLISAFSKVIVLLYGGWLVWQGETLIGTLVAFLMYQDMLFRPIRQLGGIYNDVLHAMAGGERIFQLLDTKPEISDRPDAIDLPPIKGHVVFDHVTFGYDPEVPVLNDICFEAKPGQTIALVGPTGAGKSSIINLICRFYEPQQGKILIDGYDISSVTLDSLHRQMGLVSQVNFLFSGTILDNIRYGRPDATEEEVIEAAKALGSHDIIMQLPNGYYTEVSERGESLSLGQRQLICFTRALVANPRILILDEATSAVDTTTELKIQFALERLIAGRTSFIVAHRLSTVRRADLVLVIENGRIIERGTHSELLAAGGRYAEMYEEFIRGE